jgi:signal transduction histidine kinase
MPWPAPSSSTITSDRVEALGGIMRVTSPTGHGTSVVVTIG